MMAGALVSGAPTAAAADPVPPGGYHRGLEIGPSQDAGAAAVACRSKPRIQRFEACVRIPARYWISDSQGKLLGEVHFRINQRSVLSRSSRQWRHLLELRVESGWGRAVGDTIRATQRCTGGCSATPAAHSFAMVVGNTRTMTYTATSPGKATVRHQVQVTLHAPTVGSSYPMPPVAVVRCDSQTYIAKQGGCVHPAAKIALRLSRNITSHGEVADHIGDAQALLAGHPGRPDGKPLHRIIDQDQIKQNRRKVCPPSLPRPPGKSCDEYPFASTREGGNLKSFSRRMVPANQNSAAGGLLSAFLSNHRVLAGDPYYVAIS